VNSIIIYKFIIIYKHDKKLFSAVENQWFRDRKHASMLGYRRVDRITLWLFNIAMENGPFIDDFPS